MHKIYFTSCPEGYDYDYTMTVGIVGYTGNKPVRKVVIPANRFDHQVGRYWSVPGLNADEQQFTQLVTLELVTIV